MFKSGSRKLPQICWGITKSGNKITVKVPAPQSPANVRPVTPAHGNNPAHTHVKVPPSIVKKMGG
jgi:hypothetical protein